jgi:hypothetical protein
MHDRFQHIFLSVSYNAQQSVSNFVCRLRKVKGNYDCIVQLIQNPAALHKL